mgnify:CR=1 FL=1
MVFYLSNLLLRAKRIKGNKIGVILTLISLIIMIFYVFLIGLSSKYPLLIKSVVKIHQAELGTTETNPVNLA